MDFYGGANYDNTEQQKEINSSVEKNNSTVYIYSGNSNIAQDIYFRLIGTYSANIKINSLRVTQVNTSIEDGVYIPYIVNDNIRIFKNTKAKDILFEPQYVKNINDIQDIYINQLKYKLDEVSYIKGFKDIDLSNNKMNINIIEFNNNSIKAEINSEKSSFLNYSQNYYPGWKAYLNEKQTPIYMVNGLIQGIEIPKGYSIIEFKFVPDIVYIGGTITIITLFLLIFIILRERESRIFIKKKM